MSDRRAANGAPVLLLAETGLIIRNLLLGTFADAVMESRPLVVAVRHPNDPRLRNALAGKRLTLIPFPKAADTGPLTRQRQLLTWQTYMYRFKEAEKNTSAVKMQGRLYGTVRSRTAKLAVGVLTGTGRALRHAGLLGVVENAYLSSVGRWPVTRQWQEQIQRERPAVVLSTMLTLSTNRRASVDLPVVVAARKSGAPVGTLVQSWDNLSSKTAVLPPWLDRYWTWSERMTRELLDLNPRIVPDRVGRVGSPQFDYHVRQEVRVERDTYVRALGLDPARPYVMYGAGTKVGKPFEPETAARLAERMRVEMPHCQLLVRLHPKDEPGRWEPMMARLQAAGAVVQHTAPQVHMDLGGFVPPKEFYREQINSLLHAAAVINVSSTLTVDAAILDRPVICVAYDVAPDPRFPEGLAFAYTQSTHYDPLARTGGVWIARSEEECLQAIGAYLRDPALHAPERRAIALIVTDLPDGRAGERLAEQVLELADKAL